MDPPSRPFSVEHDADGASRIITVHGDIDIFTAPEFSAALHDALLAPLIVADFSDCRYIDSSGIAVLFRMQERSKGKIRLVIGRQDMIRRILEVTRVDKFIQVFPTVEDAIKG